MASIPILPNPRVVITSHSADGKGIIGNDTLIQPIDLTSSASGSSFACFHTAAQVPTRATEVLLEQMPSIPRAPPAGAMFGSIDFLPGYSTPMHQAQSVDYAAVIEGEITLVLDGGEETTLRAGDVLVQRATSHAWVNRGESVCRIVFVAVGSEKVVLENGERLE
jgi:quercetin dioxygenase-like cupin family protein